MIGPCANNLWKGCYMLLPGNYLTRNEYSMALSRVKCHTKSDMKDI